MAQLTSPLNIPEVSPTKVSLTIQELSPTKLTRSQTLPRMHSARKQSIVKSVSEMKQEDLEAFHNWVLAIAIVNFDLDLGPVISSICPQLSLSMSESETIAFSSFPDSTSPGTHTQSHTFSTRLSDASYNHSSDVHSDSHRVIYGFVEFNQVREPSLKRGYLQ